MNNYDVFRNPVEAKDLLVEALGLDPLPGSSLYDGEKDEWFYKIMPVNRLATKAELEKQLQPFKVEIEIVDILRDKKDLVFKRESEA